MMRLYWPYLLVFVTARLDTPYSPVNLITPGFVFWGQYNIKIVGCVGHHTRHVLSTSVKTTTPSRPGLRALPHCPAHHADPSGHGHRSVCQTTDQSGRAAVHSLTKVGSSNGRMSGNDRM